MCTLQFSNYTCVSVIPNDFIERSRHHQIILALRNLHLKSIAVARGLEDRSCVDRQYEDCGSQALDRSSNGSVCLPFQLWTQGLQFIQWEDIERKIRIFHMLMMEFDIIKLSRVIKYEILASFPPSSAIPAKAKVKQSWKQKNLNKTSFFSQMLWRTSHSSRGLQHYPSSTRCTAAAHSQPKLQLSSLQHFLYSNTDFAGTIDPTKVERPTFQPADYAERPFTSFEKEQALVPKICIYITHINQMSRAYLEAGVQLETPLQVSFAASSNENVDDVAEKFHNQLRCLQH